MQTRETLEERLDRLGERLACEPSVLDRVMVQIADAGSLPSPSSSFRRVFAMMLKPPGLAAAAVIVVLVALGLWPFSGDSVSGGGSWWLAPPAVWAAELSAAIDQASSRGYTNREQSVHVLKDGTRSTSSTTGTLFVTRDRYRRDTYDEGRLRETQWYVQSKDGLTMTSVRFDQKNYTVTHDRRVRRDSVDPVTRMGALAAKLNESGRRLGMKRIDGQEAVEFEIAATKIDVHADVATIHVWLDRATKMPLRITYEFAAQNDPQSQLAATIFVQDRFDWNPKLPAETFTPRVPEGFTKVDSK